MTTELTLKRQQHNEEATLGHLYLHGKYFAYTLEDQPQPGAKVMHETRIPAGRYQIKLRTEGGMYDRYKNLKDTYPYFEGHLWLQDVPDFTYIYIHPGNTDDHTSGCILVGTSWSEVGRWHLLNSRQAYKNLYRRIIGDVRVGDCWITVEDELGQPVVEEDTVAEESYIVPNFPYNYKSTSESTSD